MLQAFINKTKNFKEMPWCHAYNNKQTRPPLTKEYLSRVAARVETDAEKWNLDVDVDVDVEDLRPQANASMPASYIAN